MTSTELNEQLTNTKCGCCPTIILDCWEKHHPRWGYFYTEKGCDDCFGSNGTCDKPGIGSKDFQGGDCDCPLCCTPFNLIADIICCIPITFGCWTVEKSN